MTTETAASATPPDYPVSFDIQRPESQSRLTNFPLGIGTVIRYFLLIPHLIVLLFLGMVAYLLYFIATFAILFTGTYPRGLFQFVVTFLRWSSNLNGYASSLYDKYPPFSGEQQDYPLTLSVSYPERSSRLLNFPFLGIYIKSFLLIPHIIVLFFLGLVVYIVIFIGQFAILFTGSFPAGMHGFVVGVSRWSTRTSAYTFGLTDKYPPFSMD